MNSLEDLSIDCLGHAGLVHEYTLVSISGGNNCKVNSKPFFFFFFNTKPFNSGFTFRGLNISQVDFTIYLSKCFLRV